MASDNKSAFMGGKGTEIRPVMKILPVEFPIMRENAARDDFGQNWQHRQYFQPHSR
jgi:hypothetical protein